MKSYKFIPILIVLASSIICCPAALGGVIYKLEVTNFSASPVISNIPETPVSICTDSTGHTTLVTSNGKIYSLILNGSPAPSMPKTLTGTGTPVAVTMDLYTAPPIYVAKNNGQIHALSLTLSNLSYSPKTFTGNPVDIATTSIGGFTYILMSSGTIYKTTIALGNINIPSPPSFSGTPTAIFAHPNLDQVWITTSTGNIYLYNQALLVQIATGSVTGTPVDIAADTAGDTVVATSQGNLYAIRRSGSTLNVNSTKNTSQTLVGVCMNYAGHVVAASQQGTVFLTTITNDTFPSSAPSTVTGNATFFDITTNLTGQIYAVGNAAVPGIVVSPSTLTFTNVVEGTTSNSQPVTISNPPGSTASLTFTIPANGFSNNMFKLSSGYTLPYTDTVAIGGSKNIPVVFNPPTGTSTTTPQTGTLTINHNVPSTSPKTVNLTGTVAAAIPGISVSPSVLTFTNVVEGTTSNSQPVTISNPPGSTASLTFTIPANGFSNNMFKLSSGYTLPYTDTVAIGGSKNIPVVFNPPTGTSTTTPQTGTLTINHNVPSTPPKTVNLSGTVVAATRILGITPSSPLVFGKVGVNYKLKKLVKFTNSGNSTLTVSSITPTNSKYTLNVSGSFQLAANGGNKEIEITFAPTTANQENGQLTITSDATATTNTLPYNLNGEGVTPTLVNAHLVLDGSGSMGETAGGGLTKMNRLISATSLFIDLARTGQGDKLGIVRFDYPTANYVANLGPITTGSKSTMKSAVALLNPGGWTSIGNGLEKAFTELTATGIDTQSHRVVLLLSDGEENRPKFVDPANGMPVYPIPTQPASERKIEIYTVGLGLAQNMNTTLLSNLAFNSANPSKGYFHLTQDKWYELHKYFISILSDTFSQYVVMDPVYHIGTGDTATASVTIVDSDKSAAFAAYWTNPSSVIDIELTAPNNITITPANAQSMGVIYGSGDLYAFYKVSFIPPNAWAGKKEGKWTLTVKGTRIPASVNKEQLSVSVIAPSDMSFKASLDKGVYSTGDTITLRAELYEQGMPIPADKIVVDVTSPNQGLGNVLSLTKLTSTDWEMKLPLAADSIHSAKLQKTAILQVKSTKPIISYSDNTITLYDDGQHNDGTAGDGIWGNTYGNTDLEGVYTFSFQALARSRLNESTTREKTLSTAVAVNKLDFTKTVILAEQVPISTPGHLGCEITVVPKDAFDNFMGPGYANNISIKASGAKAVGKIIEDNCGRYSQLIHVPTNIDPNTVNIDISIYDSQTRFNLGQRIVLDITMEAKSWSLWLVILVICIIIVLIIFITLRLKKQP